MRRRRIRLLDRLLNREKERSISTGKFPLIPVLQVAQFLTRHLSEPLKQEVLLRSLHGPRRISAVSTFLDFLLPFSSESSGEKARLRSALKRSESRKLLRAVTCPVCEKEFDTPKVRSARALFTANLVSPFPFPLLQLLPCDHVLCQGCAGNYVNPKNLLSCPVCQKEHPIPQVWPETPKKVQRSICPFINCS